MCEIAILDPAEYSTETLADISMKLYEKMRSSLGLAAIYEADDRFEYDFYRDVEPEREEVIAFIHNADDPWRLLIHGRLATHGEVIDEHAHPLEIDCRECNIDYVAHNGVVAQHHVEAGTLERGGHEYSTGVDSETLAHQTAQIPTQLEDYSPPFEWQPCVVLMNDERIYVHASRRYDMTRDMRVAGSRRSFGPLRTEQTNYEDVLVTHPAVTDE